MPLQKDKTAQKKHSRVMHRLGFEGWADKKFLKVMHNLAFFEQTLRQNK